MRLSKEAITKFKEIYLAEFNVTLSDDEANSKGLDLLNFVKLIARPIPKDPKLNKNTYETIK